MTLQYYNKLKRKQYGLARVVDRIEKEVLLELHPYGWYHLPGNTKDAYRRKLRRIVREEVLGKELMKALAETVLDGKVDSPLLQYLKSRLYQGNLRQLLSDLQSTREEK